MFVYAGALRGVKTHPVAHKTPTRSSSSSVNRRPKRSQDHCIKNDPFRDALRRNFSEVRAVASRNSL